jgi:hypothetical protein
MKKYITIPAGYRLTVVSWENDGDNYNTKVGHGLDHEETEFYIELIELCRGDYGNMYDPSKQDLEEFGYKILEIIKKFPKQVEGESFETPQDALDLFNEVVYELMGASEDYYTRVLEKWIVEYIPEPINIEDVTDSFRKPGNRYQNVS